MCGIAGIVGPSPQEGRVASMVAQLTPRGPDRQQTTIAHGTHCAATLGHSRLRIIDLSPRSDQPLSSQNGRYTLVFNGEIYNYQELANELGITSPSDSEILLAALIRWGEAALPRLRGMFAFALFDAEQNELLLVRDRFGVKPLHYVLDKDAISFASTQTPLACAFNLGPDLEYCVAGISSWAFETSSGKTPYKGMHSLGAGQLLKVHFPSAGMQVESRTYYDLPTRVGKRREQNDHSNVSSAASHIRETLSEAISLRLRADVPVGVVMSGGVDSSALACLAKEQGASLTGFHFGSPDDPHSEGPVVDSLTRELGIHVEYVERPETKQAMEQALRETLQAQDAPIRSISVIAQHLVYKRARQCGALVLLGGQGGDEAFMGYHKYQLFRIRQLLHRKRILSAARGAAQLAISLGLEALQSGLISGVRDRYSGWLARQKGQGGSVLELPNATAPQLGHLASSELWYRQAADITDFSLPTLLRYEDRNSMGNSVESRLPFMDYRVLELGLSLPDELKIRNGYGKWILRKSLDGIVPEQILWARGKRGFDVNRAAWISAGLGSALRNLLYEKKKSALSLLPPAASIDTLFSDDALKASAPRVTDALTLAWIVTR